MNFIIIDEQEKTSIIIKCMDIYESEYYLF